MLKRGPIRQIEGEPEREYWADEVLELVIWKDPDDIIGFELTVQDRMVFRVIHGEPCCGSTNPGDERHGRAGTTTIDERWDEEIDFRSLFLPRSGSLPPPAREFILERLPPPKPFEEQGRED